MDEHYLMGEMQLYEATGDISHKDTAAANLKGFMDGGGRISGGVSNQDLLALFPLFRMTREGIYENAIMDQAAKMELSIDIMPFYMAYDTNYLKKEHYSVVVKRFRQIENWTAEDLVSLTDTLGEMSEEIFEHYKTLEDLLKTVVRAGIGEACKTEDREKLAYVVLKSCRLGFLQQERFREYGQELWEPFSARCDDGGTGIGKMLYAQHLLLKKQEE